MSSQQEQDDFGAQCKAEADMSVAIDFDGVICPLGGNPIKPSLDTPPLPGAKEALEVISQHYSKIILHTCRAREDRPESAISHIEAWLEKYDLDQYFDEITSDKPRVTFYIDDKGVRHTNWDVTLAVMGIQKPFKNVEMDIVEKSNRSQLYAGWLGTDDCQIPHKPEDDETWTQ